MTADKKKAGKSGSGKAGSKPDGAGRKQADKRGSGAARKPAAKRGKGAASKPAAARGSGKGAARGSGAAPSLDAQAPLFEDHTNLRRLAELHAKGILFPCGAGRVFLGADVDPARIEAGAVIYPDTRIEGKKTLIRAGAKIGVRGSCVARDMVVGRDAELGSGLFESSVLLDKVKLGANVRVRENCLLEEQCELSFSVDVKHTFLLAHVVLGSEINFCDILMAGGTSRKDHSEIGSGVIHFNFTPFGRSGDKATASLLGDVVNGVFYRSKRIFVGGHSSLIGPIRIGYGSVVAAGSRVDRNVNAGLLTFGSNDAADDIEGFDFLCYKNIRRKVGVSVEYVAQLGALWHWYDQVRRCAARDSLDQATLAAALDMIAGGISARLDRLDTFHSYMDESIARNRAAGNDMLAGQQKVFKAKWPEFKEILGQYRKGQGDIAARDALLKAVQKKAGKFKRDFVGLITQGLDAKAVQAGTQWLQSLVNDLTADLKKIVPKL